ncbi:peptidase M20D [Xylariales sp. AK1849]|nr:peptidase M20D [Xylariales sp. AK1849]
MASISQLVADHRPSLAPLEELYRYYHANPELSNQESGTAAHIAAQLRGISPDLLVKANIGGHGLAAVLSNGDGPTVLLRADIDALPVLERTGLSYASTTRVRDAGGVEKPVMHACGHDMHIVCLLGAAKLLVSARAAWAGTLVLAFQPAEERGTGAQAMVDDGLYDAGRHGVPVPDVALGAHVMPFRAGAIGTRRGLMATSADSMRVTLHGRGSHASMPHRAIDPVVMAASTVMRLQTIVSREVDPADSAVVTVASIHAGDAENVIADDATLAIDTRSITQGTRDRILGRIKDVVRAESAAALAVREPTFETTRSFPLTVNDVGVTAKLEETFAAHFGEGKGQYDRDVARLAVSEDFSILASAVDRPSCFFLYGGTSHELWDQAEGEGTLEQRVPTNHSGFFAPVISPTLQTGLDGYAVGALTYLVKS